MPDDTSSLVAIVGTGRNGSTLLGRLLDGSPTLWVYPVEINPLSALEPRTWRAQVRRLLASGRQAQPRDIARQRFLKWALAQIAELDETYVQDLVEPLAPRLEQAAELARCTASSPFDYVACLIETSRRAYATHDTGSPILVFKTVEVSRLEEYQQIAPEMRFVHIVRHPVTNYESQKRTDIVQKKKPFWFRSGDILRAFVEDRWLAHTRFTVAARRQDPRRHYIVRYEDICADPTREVAGICSWLGVDPAADPTRQTVLGGRRLRKLPVNASQAGVATPERVIDNMASTYHYENVLTSREVDFIRLRTLNLGRALGYYVTPDEATVPSRLQLARRWLLVDDWERRNADSAARLYAALILRRIYLLSHILFPSARISKI